MEEYIKEAPQTSSLTDNRLEYQETEQETEECEEAAPEESEEQVDSKEETVAVEEEDESSQIEEDPPLVTVPNEDPIDLLGLSEVNADALKLEESNALALAIFEPGDNPPSASNALNEIGSTNGWELAIVAAPSNTNKPQLPQSQMAGGFDNLLLDSLYEDSAARRTMELHSAGYSASYGYNMNMGMPTPFDQQQPDPFAMSNNITPPTNVQMALMSQQEQMMMQQQMMMMMPAMQQRHDASMVAYNPYAAPQQMGVYSNPFGDPFNYPQPPHGNNNSNNSNALL